MTSPARPHIESLGHIGLFCFDLPAQVAFYTDVLGLTLTDSDDERGLYFLSARPTDEHHELLLQRGRDVPEGGRWVQQVSFRCPSLQDVQGFLTRFQQEGVRIDMVVSHGNAVGVYFYDPEGNRCEVYWPTGLDVPQPHLEPIELDHDPTDVLAALRASHGGDTP